MNDVSRVVHELLKDVENLKIVKDLANQGDAKVMYILGWCYLKGEFLPRDLGKSYLWLEKVIFEHHEKAEELMEYCKLFKTLKQS